MVSYKRGVDPSGWTITKRDGAVALFSPDKIRGAIDKCFCQGLGRDPFVMGLSIRKLADKVVNVLASEKKTSFHVEEVQQAVIKQLWAEGDAEAAEHYTIYREERRKAREAATVPEETKKAFLEDQALFSTPLQYYQFQSKFARWREEERRRETWREANQRVFDWFETVPEFSLFTEKEKTWLRSMMFFLKASPALRVLQMAGPALNRCQVGVYNCAYSPIKDLFCFAELLYVLMQGTGMGFSVESDYIDELPKVKKQKGNEPIPYRVEDSTEGWCDVFYFGLQKWFSGEDVEVDDSLVRPAGAKLRTKGGRASGPGPLRELLAFARKIILGAQGRRLTDLEVHDICCMTGKIVQVGGVRRASCISLSDLNSTRMREAKHGDWWRSNGQRSMANNSTVYNERPPVEVFMEEFLALVKSKSGERGIFNRHAATNKAPKRRKKVRFGANPCLEIILRSAGFCNLTMAIFRSQDTVEEMVEKVRGATYFGVIQSCCTKFNYIREEWKKNAEEERLLGVDIMGHLDHPLLQPGAEGRKELVGRFKEVVAETAQELSKRFGINYSTANTCLKPGGDSGAFFDSVSLSPYYGRHMIRRTRESVSSPVYKFLKDQGVPCEPASEDESRLAAFSWPKTAPEGAITRHDMSAIEQLENWLFWKQTWAEHSCSVTIYVKEHEWPEVGAWAWKNFDEITGVSFLPWDNGSYRTAPLEEITKERYEEMLAAFPKLDWSKLSLYEKEDATESARTFACSGDSCFR